MCDTTNSVVYGDMIPFCEWTDITVVVQADLMLHYRLDVQGVGGAIRGFLS